MVGSETLPPSQFVQLVEANLNSSRHILLCAYEWFDQSREWHILSANHWNFLKWNWLSLVATFACKYHNHVSHGSFRVASYYKMPHIRPLDTLPGIRSLSEMLLIHTKGHLYSQCWGLAKKVELEKATWERGIAYQAHLMRCEGGILVWFWTYRIRSSHRGHWYAICCRIWLLFHADLAWRRPDSMHDSAPVVLATVIELADLTNPYG